MARLVKIYPENPNEREILKIVEVLKNGGVIIYPSDTVYALGCDITNYKAMERVAHSARSAGTTWLIPPAHELKNFDRNGIT